MSPSESLDSMDSTGPSPDAGIEYARLRLLEYALSHSLDELLVATIDEAELLTGSKVGFYHFLEEDQITLALQAWSTRTTHEMCKAEGKGQHYRVAEAGVWTACIQQRRPVIHNDYMALPNRKGLPPGHAPVVRELVVPVFRGDLIVAILGVGNKETDYDQSDITAVSRLADLAWDITGRKRAEDALRQSEEAYRHQFSENTAAMLLTDLTTGRIVEANAAALQIYGFTHERMLEHHLADLITQPIVTCSIMQAGDPVDHSSRFEFQHRTADGSTRDVEVFSSRGMFGPRKVLFSIVVDVTERKRMQEELRESRRTLWTLMNNLPGMAYRCRNDRSWTMEFVSEGALALTGYSAGELIQSTRISYNDLIVAEDRTMVWDNVQAAIRQRQPFQLTYRITNATGERKWVFEKGVGVFSDQGQLVGLEGFIMDVTARAQAESVLRQQDRLIAMAGATAHFGGWLVDLKDQRVVWSDQVALIHEVEPGYSPSVTEGLAFYAPEWRTLIQEAFAACAREGKPYDKEVEIVTRHGRRVWVRTTGQAVRDSSGAIVSVQGSFQDIDARKRSEKQRLELDHQLFKAQKAESLGRMAGAIAHHFNNQLQAVLGNLELARLEIRPGSEAEKCLREATAAGTKAAELGRLMLTYLGQSHGKHEPLDLTKVCQNTLPVLRAAAPNTVRLEAALPTPGPCLKGDPHQIQQLLTNLITNAWESLAPQGGSIHVHLQTVLPSAIVEAQRIPTDWQPANQPHACLEVRDTGCGMDEKTLENLFDPFFSTKFTGRGLGLPVVLGVVRAHSGAITVTSEPGQGSTFRIYLPVTGESLPQPTPLPPPANATLERGSAILLVEDEPAVRKVARDMIEHLGYRVLEATDGVEAQTLFAAHQDEVRLTVCDLSMPRMDGWATLAALRKRVPNLAVILASGYQHDQIMNDQHEEMPQAFLQKPYTVAGLKEALQLAYRRCALTQ